MMRGKKVFKRIPVIPVMVFVATALVGGVAMILVSRAATYVSQAEAEAGTVTLPAVKLADTAASGGQAVRFGSVVTPPPPVPPTPPPSGSRTCTNPLFTTSGHDDGWTNGGYYVHNNMWNWQEGGPETLYACAYNNWYVDSTQPNTTSVKTYPNVHLDINDLNGKPYKGYKTITSTFAGVGPKTGIYDVAYDLWLNGVGWGGGTTEVMVWTENMKQQPLGSIKASFTEPAGGADFNVWTYREGSDVNVVSFQAKQTLPSGTFNLKAMIDWAISKGYIPANPSINQIGYGVEICSTNNTKQRFTFSDFSVTMN